MLVFDRIWRAIGEKFHHIAFSDEAKAIRPYRQSSFATAVAMGFVVYAIHLFVFRIAARGVDIVRELAFHVYQPATARAVGPVVKGGKRNRVEVDHMGGVAYRLCQSALVQCIGDCHVIDC